MEKQNSVGKWLEEKCRQEHLTLRKAGNRAGLSHTTIAEVIRGKQQASWETIKRLAKAFSNGDGHHRRALEDKLLTLAGYRSQCPEEELSEPQARLLDKVKQFSEPKIRIMEHFADYISEIDGGGNHEC